MKGVLNLHETTHEKLLQVWRHSGNSWTQLDHSVATATQLKQGLTVSLYPLIKVMLSLPFSKYGNLTYNACRVIATTEGFHELRRIALKVWVTSSFNTKSQLYPDQTFPSFKARVYNVQIFKPPYKSLGPYMHGHPLLFRANHGHSSHLNSIQFL